MSPRVLALHAIEDAGERMRCSRTGTGQYDRALRAYRVRQEQPAGAFLDAPTMPTRADGVAPFSMRAGGRDRAGSDRPKAGSRGIQSKNRSILKGLGMKWGRYPKRDKGRLPSAPASEGRMRRSALGPTVPHGAKAPPPAPVAPRRPHIDRWWQISIAKGLPRPRAPGATAWLLCPSTNGFGGWGGWAKAEQRAGPEIDPLTLVQSNVGRRPSSRSNAGDTNGWFIGTVGSSDSRPGRRKKAAVSRSCRPCRRPANRAARAPKGAAVEGRSTDRTGTGTHVTPCLSSAPPRPPSVGRLVSVYLTGLGQALSSDSERARFWGGALHRVACLGPPQGRLTQ